MKPVIPNLITPIVRNDGIAAQTMRAWMESITDLFYQIPSQDALIHFNSNATSTAFTAVNTAVEVNAIWISDILNHFTHDVNGRVKSVTNKTLIVPVDVVVYAKAISGASKDVSLYLAKNGVKIATTRTQGTVKNTERARFVIPWQISLSKDDYLSVMIENNTDAVSVICEQGILRIR